MAQEIRVSEINIENIKNVSYGKIYFSKTNKNNSNIVGIYGQNGSGKTALVNAFEIVQALLSGLPLTKKMASYISLESHTASIEISFTIEDEDSDNSKELKYCIFLEANEINEPQLIREIIKLSKNEKTPLLTIYDCEFNNENIVFSPATHFNKLKNNKTNFPKMMAQKLYAKKQCQSLFFSEEFINILQDSNEEPSYIQILKHLQHFARIDLFIIKNSSDGIMNIASLLPVSFKISQINDNSKRILKGNAPIVINEPSDIPYQLYDIITDIIKQMNIVISKLIPNMQIDVVKLGEQLSAEGDKTIRVEYVSKKTNYQVPLRNESEGIRKLISMIGAIINFYNKKEAFTIIDEIDAGIYEYLLGELLEVLQEGGRGQLLFTSHNLRPLEKLKKENLYFTTCNEKNRFVKLKNVKSNNNLRDFYYRAIQLGGQSEILYETTNFEELSIALAKAGQYVKS